MLVSYSKKIQETYRGTGMRDDIAHDFRGIDNRQGLVELWSEKKNEKKNIVILVRLCKGNLPIQSHYCTKLWFTYLLTAAQMRSSVKRQNLRMRYCTLRMWYCHHTWSLCLFFKLTINQGLFALQTSKAQLLLKRQKVVKFEVLQHDLLNNVDVPKVCLVHIDEIWFCSFNPCTLPIQMNLPSRTLQLRNLFERKMKWRHGVNAAIITAVIVGLPEKVYQRTWESLLEWSYGWSHVVWEV